MTSESAATHFSLRIGNTIGEMKNVVDLVEQFGTVHNVSKKAINELNLCLDEILNNTISYGYEDKGFHSILVTLTLVGDLMIAEIVDDGKPFDPRQATPPDPSQGLGERKVGGVGLHFVKALMDKVDYSRKKGCNHLKLHKKL
jgi:anti-sigma regulatory factor (Ser/Thr protein kinase)